MFIKTFTGGNYLQNCYLASCEHTGESVIIDPGAAVPQLLSSLEENGKTVVAVILTHGHFDHIEGLEKVREVTHAPVYMHGLDQDIFDNFPVQAAQFGILGEPLSNPECQLEGGELIEVGCSTLKVLHTPGHSPGHVVLVNDPEKIAFVGDLIFRGSVGRTDLTGGDSGVLFNSIRDHILTLSDDFRLFSGHGPDTTVGIERETNPFLTGSFMGNDL